MSDDTGKKGSVLTEQIDELESLINSRAEGANKNLDDRESTIPILDELVTADDYDISTDVPDDALHQEHRLDLLAGRLEQKIFSELDEIVSILKGNLKKNIMDELQDQLKAGADKQTDN